MQNNTEILNILQHIYQISIGIILGLRKEILNIVDASERFVDKTIAQFKQEFGNESKITTSC